MRRAGAAFASVALIGGLLVTLPVQAAEVPAVGECLDYVDLESLQSPGTTVACTSNHNAEVFAVGTAPSSLGLPSQAFLPDQQRSQLCTPPGARDARSAMLDYLGLRGATIPLRTYFAVKLPTDAQWGAGERWVRCLVGVTYESTESPLLLESWSGPAPERTADSGAGWLLACSGRTPISAAIEVTVACAGGSWALVVNGVAVSGTAATPYPGAALQSAADTACRAQTQPWLRAGSGDRFVAALVPRGEWEAGSRVALCWIPVSEWNGAVDDTPPPTPIPADATVTVTGPSVVTPNSAQVYRIIAAVSDETPLPQVDALITVNGSAALAEGGTEVLVSTGEDGVADVTVTSGARGSFTVSAVLAGATSIAGSLEVTITPAPKPEPIIDITGKRAKVSKKKGVEISGRTLGVPAKATVIPYFKLAGQKKFTKDRGVKVSAKGTFTWKRVAPKSITVYVTWKKVASNRITIK